MTTFRASFTADVVPQKLVIFIVMESVLHIRCCRFRTARCSVSGVRISSTSRVLSCSRRTRLLTALLTLSLANVGSSQRICTNVTSCYPPLFDLLENLHQYPLRTLEASTTCGDPEATEYQIQLNVTDDTVFSCNSSTNTLHFVSNMYDSRPPLPGFTVNTPDLTTYWQSKNTVASSSFQPRQESITLSLTDPFFIAVVEVKFIAPHYATDTADVIDTRPVVMAIEKQTRKNGPWVPLRYFAQNCRRYFPQVPRFGSIRNFLIATCAEKYYGGDLSTQVPGPIQQVGRTKEDDKRVTFRRMFVTFIFSFFIDLQHFFFKSRTISRCL